MPDHPPVQWKRTLYIVWLCQFIVMLGMSMVVPFLPFYVRELGAGNEQEVAFWSGLAFSGPFILQIFFAPIWGAVGDRYGHKLMIVRAIVGLTVSQALIGLAANPQQLFIFRLLQGAISGFLASSLALVSTVTPEESNSYALGILQSSTSAGAVFGPFIGGLFADTLGYRTIFFVVSGMIALTGLLVLLHVPRVAPSPQALGNKRPSALQNLALLVSHPLTAVSVASVVLVQISLGLSRPVFALFMEQLLGVIPYLATVTGLLFAVMGVFSLIGAPFWGKRGTQYPVRRSLLQALAGTAVCLFCHTFVGGAVSTVVVRAGLGFFSGGLLPLLYSTISNHVNVERRGGVMGATTSFTMAGNMLGPVIGGALPAILPLEWTFTFGGVVCFLCAILVYRYFAPLNKQGRNPASQAGEGIDPP